jgi:CDP-diacylglycerol--glycerol-3-phosphate 3-phosphatidyltransferase
LAVLAFIAITVRISLSRYRQRETDPGVTGSAVLGPGIRGWYFENLQPFEEWCVRWAVSPTHLSFAQLLGSALVGVGYAAGAPFTAGWLLLLTGTLDIIDGRVARRTGGASARGAFLDSVIDRYVESFAYFGLAVYFRTSWALWAVLFALLGSLMVSYARARAEGLGIALRGGTFQRPERIVFLGFGTVFGGAMKHLTEPWFPGTGYALIIATVLFLAVVANMTALQRSLNTWRALDAQAVQPHAETDAEPDPYAMPPPRAAEGGPAAGKAKRVTGTFILMIAAGCILDRGAVWTGSLLLLLGTVVFAGGLLALRSGAPARATGTPDNVRPNDGARISHPLRSHQ